ncbi:hypothetical protein BJ741DRAFT_93698, partial [Chytriomyces cf. hyalinus JEL632]
MVLDLSRMCLESRRRRVMGRLLWLLLIRLVGRNWFVLCAGVCRLLILLLILRLRPWRSDKDGLGDGLCLLLLVAVVYAAADQQAEEYEGRTTAPVVVAAVVGIGVVDQPPGQFDWCHDIRVWMECFWAVSLAQLNFVLTARVKSDLLHSPQNSSQNGKMWQGNSMWTTPPVLSIVRLE